MGRARWNQKKFALMSLKKNWFFKRVFTAFEVIHSYSVNPKRKLFSGDMRRFKENLTAIIVQRMQCPCHPILNSNWLAPLAMVPDSLGLSKQV